MWPQFKSLITQKCKEPFFFEFIGISSAFLEFESQIKSKSFLSHILNNYTNSYAGIAFYFYDLNKQAIFYNIHLNNK